MTKLLNAFIASPTPKNAAKIKAYLAKHPMAACMLTPEVSTIVEEIVNHK